MTGICFRTRCKTEVRIMLFASKVVCLEPPYYCTCTMFLSIHKIISIYQLPEFTTRRLAKVLGVWCTNNIEMCAVKRIHMRGTFQETSQRHLAVINHKGTVSCCQKQRPFRKRTKYIEQQKETISYIVYCIKSDGNRRKRNLVARYSGIFIAPNYVMQVRERLDLDREFMHCNSLLRKSLFYSLDSLRYSRHTISKTHIHLRVWVRVFLLV